MEDFAGWGTASAAAGHILEFLIARGEMPDEHVRWDLVGGGIRCARAADVLEHCRKALMAHKGAVQPACVMGNMLDRTPPEYLDRLDRLVASANEAAKGHICVYIDMQICRNSSVNNSLSKQRLAWPAARRNK